MSTNKLAIAMCDECEKMDNDYYEELIWDGVQFKCRRGHTEDIPQMLRNFKRAPELYDDLQAIIDHLRIIEARKKQLEAFDEFANN